MAVQVAVQMTVQVAEQICKALISSAVLGRGSRNQFVINTKNLDPVNKIKVTAPLFLDKMEHKRKPIWLMFESPITGKCIPGICQFWYTTISFWPIKVQRQGRRFLQQSGQNGPIFATVLRSLL